MLVRLGAVDSASIEVRDESKLLVQANDSEKNIESILPVKLKYHMDYVRSRTVVGGIIIILRTF